MSLLFIYIYVYTNTCFFLIPIMAGPLSKDIWNYDRPSSLSANAYLEPATLPGQSFSLAYWKVADKLFLLGTSKRGAYKVNPLKLAPRYPMHKRQSGDILETHPPIPPLSLSLYPLLPHRRPRGVIIYSRRLFTRKPSKSLSRDNGSAEQDNVKVMFFRGGKRGGRLRSEAADWNSGSSARAAAIFEDERSKRSVRSRCESQLSLPPSR